MKANHISDDGNGGGVIRRGFIAAAGSAAAAATLAGCSGVTQQSFAASPVVLPEPTREELVLAETARDSRTVSREGPTGNVEVTVTSHGGVYQRGPARGTPTVLEQFTSMVNGTPGSGSAIDAVASELGIEEAPLSFTERRATVSGDRFSLVLPAGIRTTNFQSPFPEQIMPLVPGAAIEENAVTYSGDGPEAYVPYADFAPGAYTHSAPSGGYSGVADFVPGSYTHDSSGDPCVFLPAVDPLLDRLGMDSLPADAERVEPGHPTDTANTVFAAPGDVLLPKTTFERFEQPTDAFDHGYVLSLGGGTFGLGVLSTPDASVAGRSANPLVGMETTELLQRDAIRNQYFRLFASGDRASGAEWRVGPTAVGPDSGYLVGGRGGACTLLGNETQLRPFVGVVEGENGLWGLLLHVARITEDDHVVAASAIRRPVGTVDGGMETISRFVPERERPYSGLREFSAAAIGRLARQDGQGGDRP